MASCAEVELLRRQYRQLLDPRRLLLPPANMLKRPEVQAQMFSAMFQDDDGLVRLPPDSYKLRVLKMVVDGLEKAIDDPEEDEISDRLVTSLAELMSRPQATMLSVAQQTSVVTYTMPIESLRAPSIIILEARAVLMSSGATGLRTWEAALCLGTHLCTDAGKALVEKKSILELGAGTGFVSLLCAKYLKARKVIATDGSPRALDCLETNIALNGLEGRPEIETACLKWGVGSLDALLEPGAVVDLVIGTDVTYDQDANALLAQTLQELLLRFPGAQGLIVATVRSDRTWQVFAHACGERNLRVQCMDLEMVAPASQLGFFHATDVPMRTYLISAI